MPVTGGACRICIDLFHDDPVVLAAVRFVFNGTDRPARFEPLPRRGRNGRRAVFDAELTDDYSILELIQPEQAFGAIADRKRRGIGAGALQILAPGQPAITAPMSIRTMLAWLEPVYRYQRHKVGRFISRTLGRVARRLTL